MPLTKGNNTVCGGKMKIYLPLYKLEEFQPATSNPVTARNIQIEE
jgi:hypothetical protein